jgi:hypothetical protein
MPLTKEHAVLIALTFTALAAAKAEPITITYSFSGAGTVVGSTDTTLTLDTQASGSILSASPGMNAAWNPISYSELCVLDLTTNLLQGNFTITFQDGDTLTGTDLENDTALDTSPTQTGPFSQTLTFTGGAGIGRASFRHFRASSRQVLARKNFDS